MNPATLMKAYVGDTETTGLASGPEGSEINQISLIRCEDRFQKTVNILIERFNKVSKKALAIQNKTISDLRKGITKEEAVDIIESYILNDGMTPDHRIMICHNAAFDRRFLHALWESVGRTFPINNWICTMAYVRLFCKKYGIVKPKVNLEASLKHVGLVSTAGMAHNSVIDTKNTFNLYNKIQEAGVSYLPIIKVEPHILGLKKTGKKKPSSSENNTNPDEMYEDF